MNLAKTMLTAMTGPDSGPVAAYLMAKASYAYTRSWDGCEGPDGTPMQFGRWYAFKEAVKLGWEYLWKGW